jgi:hypothetical protein
MPILNLTTARWISQGDYCHIKGLLLTSRVERRPAGFGGAGGKAFVCNRKISKNAVTDGRRRRRGGVERQGLMA